MNKTLFSTLRYCEPPIAGIALFAVMIQLFAEPFQMRPAYAFLMNPMLAVGVQVPRISMRQFGGHRVEVHIRRKERVGP